MGHRRHAAVRRQRVKPGADIDRPARKELRGERHDAAADERIRRRIGRAAVEIRPLEIVRENGRIPFVRELFEAADVIGVPVRQDDRRGSHARAEALFRGAFN